MPLLQLMDPPPRSQGIPQEGQNAKEAFPEKVSQEQVKDLLARAGLGKSAKKTIKQILEDHEIDTEGAISVIAMLALRGESDQIRLRAAEMALKLGGDLVETPQVPIVNIVINDKEANFTVNPILIPR